MGHKNIKMKLQTISKRSFQLHFTFVKIQKFCTNFFLLLEIYEKYLSIILNSVHVVDVESAIKNQFNFSKMPVAVDQLQGKEVELVKGKEFWVS